MVGRFKILLNFFAWVVLAIAQPAGPSPVPNPVGGGLIPAVPNLGMGGKPFINNLPQLNPLNPVLGGGPKMQISELGADSTQNAGSVEGEEVLEVDFDFAAGRSLRLFGLDFFQRPPGGAGLDVVPVYEDYRVGSGDEVLIRAWGAVDINLRLTVDREGAINIPQVGIIQVANLRASELEGFVEAQVGEIFRNFEMNVTLGRLRSIQVFVVGQARRPGKYTVSAWSSLVNALIASGGPSGVGSMRSIQVKRAGQDVAIFDLYDLLMKGDKSKDVRLKHGDVIFIPARGNLAGISGQVKVPAVYELKGDESVEDLLQYAEGFTATAFQGRIHVERIKDHKMREIKVLDWEKSENRSEPVQDGDMVQVVPISPRYDQVVMLAGHVSVPRRENWKAGMRITDLIPNRSDLIPRTYWDAKNELLRLSDEDASTEGEVEGAGFGEYLLSANSVRRFRFLELVRGARKLLAEVNWEYASIQRINPESLENEFTTFNLGKALRENDPEHNLLLKSGDVITIYKRSDIRVPKSQRQEFVSIEGEVAKPGLYEIRAGETLPQLIQRAGGLTRDAYLYASVFTRESVRAEQRRRMEEAAVRMQQELARTSARMQAEETNADAKASMTALMEARQRAIAQSRATIATGRIVLDIPSGTGTLAGIPNLELEDGDLFVIPAHKKELHIMGEVFNSQSTVWKQGETALDVLTTAGGPKKHADMKQMFIIRANGSVKSYEQLGKKFIQTTMFPGDTLVVPEELDYQNWKYELKEWVKIFSDFAIGAAAIRVLSRD